MAVFVGEEQHDVTGTQSDFDDMANVATEFLLSVSRQDSTIDQLADALSPVSGVLNV